MPTRTTSRVRNRGPTAPSTGLGWSRAAAATANRSGSVTHRAMSGTSGKRHHGQGEHAAEAQGGRGQAVEHRGQAGPDAVAGGDQGHGPGPLAAPRLLGRHHLGQGVGGTEERATQGEHGDEPPVPGAGRRRHGGGQADDHGHQQHPPPPEPVGQSGQRQCADRRQADDGQPDPELGTRQAGLSRSARPRG